MARIGHTQCGAPGCTNPEATVSRTPTGTLSVSCHRCEFSGFAKSGTRAHRLLTAAMTLDDDAPAAPPTTPAAAAPVAPVAHAPKPIKTAPAVSTPRPPINLKTPMSAFSLGDL